MTQTLTVADTYKADYLALEDRAPAGPEWLRDLRQRGLETFSELGFPTARRDNERWKYTNIAPIARSTFEYAFGHNQVTLAAIRAIVPWDESWSRLVFIDGHYSELLSNDVTAEGLRLSTAASLSLNDTNAHLNSLANTDDNAFTALNTAFLRDGAIVELAENVEDAVPIQLIYVSTERDRPYVTHPRTLVVAGHHSKLTILETYVGLSDSPYFTNAVTEVVVGKGAQIEHYRYMNESTSAFHVGSSHVHLDSESSFRSVSFSKGAHIARNGLDVVLDAPGASCDLNGLYYTSSTEHIDNHINVDHARPHTSSNQYFKGILADESRAVFSGRVLVQPNAQKSHARQADKNLLLSEGARINTKPSLEIYADDVQCFHGATAGTVAKDSIFYMMSRGIDEKTARSLFIHGFAGEIIDTIKLQPLRSHLDQMFNSDLSVSQANE